MISPRTIPVLEVNNLVCHPRTAHRGFRRVKETALINGVTFSIEAGQCLGLLGDSGSGKSTIARCVAGLTEPNAGSISIQGYNVYPERKNRRHLTAKVQMLYQDHSASLDPMLTIGASLAEAARAGRVSFQAEHSFLLKILEDVGLTGDVLGRYPRSLSGGERQRVALARSLAVDPILLVLDEPTSALDAATQTQILNLLATVRGNSGTAVLFISHDIDAIVRLCSHIAVLCDGRIVECNTTDAVISHPLHPYTQRIVELHR